MTVLKRIGALDIAEEISARIGSYVDMSFMEFLAVEDDFVHCWYMNGSGHGPSYAITLTRVAGGWTMQFAEHPPGTEQSVEIP